MSDKLEIPGYENVVVHKSDITNEEKAKEIAAQYARPYGFGLNNDSSIECYQSAIEAMKWKDEQFSKIINDLPQSVNDLIETLAK